MRLRVQKESIALTINSVIFSLAQLEPIPSAGVNGDILATSGNTALLCVELNQPTGDQTQIHSYDL